MGAGVCGRVLQHRLLLKNTSGAAQKALSFQVTSVVESFVLLFTKAGISNGCDQ